MTTANGNPAIWPARPHPAAPTLSSTATCASSPPGSETVMTSRITPAAVITAHAQGRATLPWVPTPTGRQRRALAARPGHPGRTLHLAAARP